MLTKKNDLRRSTDRLFVGGDDCGGLRRFVGRINGRQYFTAGAEHFGSGDGKSAGEFPAGTRKNRRHSQRADGGASGGRGRAARRSSDGDFERRRRGGEDGRGAGAT